MLQSKFGRRSDWFTLTETFNLLITVIYIIYVMRVCMGGGVADTLKDADQLVRMEIL